MSEPAEVFCMQEYLAEEMQTRGWKTEDVAVRMGTHRGAAMDLFLFDIIMCVPDEKLIIDDEMFTAFGRAFGVDPQFLKNLHAVWLAHPGKRAPFNVPDSLFGPTSRRAMMRVVN